MLGQVHPRRLASQLLPRQPVGQTVLAAGSPRPPLDETTFLYWDWVVDPNYYWCGVGRGRHSMPGQPTYVYEPGSVKWPEKALELIDDYDLDMEVIDASDWDDTERQEFYQTKLFPRSIRQGKKLRGQVRTHKAGNINFFKGVLMTGDIEDGDFFVGKEAIERLGSMAPGHS